MIDAHCHIDRFPNPVREVARVEKERIRTVAVTTLPSHFEMALPHLRGKRFIYLALGLHPLVAEEHDREWGDFLRLLPQADFIGEIGLDFSKQGIATKETQVRTWLRILPLLRQRRRFVTVHSRGAEHFLLESLADLRVSPVVLHWYSGPLELIASALTEGHYFSVNPAMANSEKGRSIIQSIPLERLLTESDGPYCVLGGRPARPSDVGQVLAFLAQTHKMSSTDIEQILHQNFQRITSSINC